MKTIDLNERTVSGDELVKLAARDVLLIISKAGEKFVLEGADPFELEVQKLGQSRKFMDFLTTRAKEKASVSIDDFARQLHRKTR